MKKITLLSAVFICIFASCKKEKTEEVIPAIPTETVAEETVTKECYLGIFKNDTVSMTLNIKGNQIVDGKLSYKFFQKDKNEGRIVGTVEGDTLFADYTFISEGVESVRQVAFLKKGDVYTEGYGDVADVNGKSSFKNTKQLKFEGKPTLSKVGCKM